MAGRAVSREFMLGTATVMLGAMADLYTLETDTHSIGLVKNLTMTTEPSYVELTQGVTNTIVDSTMNGNPVRATMEAYEFTAKNLSYALGLEGSDLIAPNTVTTTLSAPVTASSTSATVTSPTGITVGKYIAIYGLLDDIVHVRKVTAVAASVLTVDKPLPALATGLTVKVVTGLAIGSTASQPYFACKIVGVLASGEKVVVYIPKVRIVRGFNLAFTTTEHGNLPIELTVYDLVSTDTFYSDFRDKNAQLFRT